MGGLEKLIHKSTATVLVEVGKPSKRHKSGPIFYAEANLKIDGKLLRAEATHADLRTAIDKVRDELHIQIKKFKERKKDFSRKPKK